VEHFPELVCILHAVCLIVIGHRKLRPEKEIPDRVLMEDAVNEDPFCMTLKVDAVVAAAKSVERPPIALDLAEVLSFQRVEIVGHDLELGKQVELEIFRECAHFRRTDWIEDDLEHG
jgi:hypothetical protein